MPGGTLRRRITVVAATVTLGCLLALALLAGRGLEPLLVGSVDDELAAALRPAAAAVRAGEVPAEPPGLLLRVLDTAGDPVDGRAGRPLAAGQVRELKAGLPVRTSGDPPVRWQGVVVTDPDGAPRLVAVGAGLVGYADAEADGANGLLIAALVAAVVAGVVIWLAVGSALRPVGRMRRSVGRLAGSQRLPLPRSGDELRA
ncbi:MAG: two-component sensor histidine kinase, partial [Thermocrispum sp.]